MRQLGRLVEQRGFFKIAIKERAGVPGEARPSITIRLASGETRTVAKWANDKHPDFDAIYHWLLEQIQKAQQGKPVYEGPYDPRWKPDRFVAQ
jgi:hypothetical protein